MTPSPGRIVHYMLTAQDAEQINRRRTSGASIAERIGQDKWPLGAQAHIGNEAREGDVYPMVIIRVFDPDPVWRVNGQVLLDGNDTFWATSRGQVVNGSVDAKGCWFEPPRV